MKSETDPLSLRFLEIRKHLRLTQKVFSTSLGVSSGYISLVEGGKRRASVEMLLGVAREFPQLSRDWLLTGEGEMLQKLNMPQTSASAFPDLRAAQAMEAHLAEEALGLGEVASLARLGTAGRAWDVMETLLNASPQGLRLEDIAQTVNNDPLEVSALLTLLCRSGKLEEGENGRYRLRPQPESGFLKSETIPDKHQTALRASSLILKRVLPAMDSKQGKITIIEGRVADPAPLLEKWESSINSLLLEAAQSEGEGHDFTVVICLATELSTE